MAGARHPFAFSTGGQEGGAVPPRGDADNSEKPCRAKDWVYFRAL
jgi:hypothetical protein